MTQHRYKLGQLVEFLSRSQDSGAPRGAYKVHRLLPTETGVPQYRIRHVADGHERAVAETQIAASDGPASAREALFSKSYGTRRED